MLGTRADLAALDEQSSARMMKTMRSDLEGTIAAEAALIRGALVIVKDEFHTTLEIEERRELTSAEEEEMEAFLAEAERLAAEA